MDGSGCRCSARVFPEGGGLRDIGSQASQLYLSLRERNPRFQYQGYEMEEKYIEIALRKFPELAGSLVHADFLEVESPPLTEVSVVSATLEHIERWEEFLSKVLGSTSTLVLVRTFLGIETLRFEARKEGSSSSYPIWQFEYDEICRVFSSHGYEVTIRRDLATDSMPVWKVFKGGSGVLRTCFLIVAKKDHGWVGETPPR